MNESHSAPSFISEPHGQAPFVLPCYAWFRPKISDSFEASLSTIAENSALVIIVDKVLIVSNDLE